MVGGLLKPLVNWPKIVEPMPTITASTRIFTPDETTLPSTFSARKAVRPNRPNGTSTKPASVVSLNSIRLTKSWIAMMKKLMTTIIQATSRMMICTRFAKTLVKPIIPEIEVRMGLPASMPTWASLPGCRSCDGVHRAAARLDAEAGEGIVDDLGEVVVVADDEGEDADIERLLDQPGEHVLVGRQRPEQAGERDVDADQNAGEPAHIALHQAEAGIDILREGPEEPVDDAGAAHRRLPSLRRRRDH